MAIAETHSAQVHLLDATTVQIEVDIAGGLYAFSVVGLPDKAVEEARDRVAAALKNTGLPSPKQQNEKVVVSLSPAQLKKEGAVFDLPMAIGYLAAAGEIDTDLSNILLAGELALDGTLRPISGALSLARHAHSQGFSELIVPAANAREAALIEGVTVYGATSLSDIVAHLQGTHRQLAVTPPSLKEFGSDTPPEVDISEVKGQESAKRGLMIAAAGDHNAAMSGPPGTGKTMLAKACAGILPRPSFDEMLEITAIHSVAGELNTDLITRRPFRAPHHTASHVSLIGGGQKIMPGEATLAHRGLLFCDEFPEFDRRVIESLRQPLEECSIQIARAGGRATFPASFVFIAAMNPCPCGNYGVEGKQCQCTPYYIQRYRHKLSGPIADRIDLWLDVHRVDHDALKNRTSGKKTSSEIRAEVEAARSRALTRSGKPNAALSSDETIRDTSLNDDAQTMLTTAARQYDLSARSYYKVLKIARTIADLDKSDVVTSTHLGEALRYRPRE